MSHDKTIHTAIIRHARNTEALKTFTSAQILVDEGDQVFASYEIPGRGSVSAWVKVDVPETFEQEPRTIAFLRDRIDEIDFQRNRCMSLLAERKADLKGSYSEAKREDFDPLLSLTVLLAEEEITRLTRELNELWDEAADNVEHKED
jgi:hypothetical protein